MNQRLKELRKTLGLSGEKFGEPLGVQRNAISRIETGKNGLSDQMIKLICLTYKVSEEWLRTGQGDMFISTQAIPIDELLREADPLELKVIKAYFTLDKDLRSQVLDHFKKTLQD
ncbi:MAG: helix-turn-helix transcriptional regulator [Tissierellia bacterium]|nr:helix-turn-helix transcriptional regulator [Tissierellia bacterium]